MLIASCFGLWGMINMMTDTLVPAVQKAAQKALTGQRGAILALDPKTGALIAAASAPTIRLAQVRMPSRAARSTASLTARVRPKSSAVTMRRFMAR